jgi:hypothetical protein
LFFETLPLMLPSHLQLLSSNNTHYYNNKVNFSSFSFLNSIFPTSLIITF